MTEEDELQTDRQIIAEATPGPWIVCNPDDSLCMNALVIAREGASGELDDHENNVAITLLQEPRYADVDDCKWHQNADFIARARTRWPKLVERIAKLEGLPSTQPAGSNEAQPTNVTWHSGTVSRTQREKLLGQKGVTLWLTGLSASGKSTIAVLLEQMLIERGRLAYRLDGDNIRHGLNRNLGFSAEDRAENIRRIGEVARLFTDAGVIVICSFISPYRRDRDAIRGGMNPGDFVEIYVKASLQAAEARDPKGLYRKARAGQIKGFTGIDDPYEPPEKSEILIDTESTQPQNAAGQILSYLEIGGYLH